MTKRGILSETNDLCDELLLLETGILLKYLYNICK